jgi:hypothetical protein
LNPHCGILPGVVVGGFSKTVDSNRVLLQLIGIPGRHTVGQETQQLSESFRAAESVAPQDAVDLLLGGRLQILHHKAIVGQTIGFCPLSPSKFTHG